MKRNLCHGLPSPADARPGARAGSTLALAVAMALGSSAGTASAAFVHTYTSSLNFVFEFETATALAYGTESRLVLAPDSIPSTGIVQRWSFRYVTPTPTPTTISFGSDSVGETFGELNILLGSGGELERICGDGALAGVGSFFLNNAATPGGMLTGTRCASVFDNYEAFSLVAGFAGQTRGLGQWAVREVMAPPPPPPPPTSGAPEPGSLLLAAAALLALRGAQRGTKAGSRATGAA